MAQNLLRVFWIVCLVERADESDVDASCKYEGNGQVQTSKTADMPRRVISVIFHTTIFFWSQFAIIEILYPSGKLSISQKQKIISWGVIEDDIVKKSREKISRDLSYMG
jgi:hypothetical protein